MTAKKKLRERIEAFSETEATRALTLLDLEEDVEDLHWDGPDELPEPKDHAAFLAAIDKHLATATPHPAGTTDRLLAEDRNRPY